MPVSRRDFLAGSSAALITGAALSETSAAEQVQPPSRPLRVAAINSIFRLRSHAYHIVGRMVHGYTWNGFHHQPALQVVRMFNDFTPKDDLSVDFCKRHNIELCKSAQQALGGDKLDVDAWC